MTEEEVKEAIKAIRRAAEAIASLPADFKAPRGWMNLDYELDRVADAVSAERFAQNGCLL